MTLSQHIDKICNILFPQSVEKGEQNNMTTTKEGTRCSAYRSLSFNLLGNEITTYIGVVVKFLNKKTQKYEERIFINPTVVINDRYIVIHYGEDKKFETVLNNISLSTKEIFVVKYQTKDDKEHQRIIGNVVRGENAEALDIQALHAYSNYREELQKLHNEKTHSAASTSSNK